VEAIINLKKQYPEAKVLVHPECKGPVVKLADVVGSTAKLLKYAVESDDKKFIVATESGIIFEMKRQAPEKEFIPVPPKQHDAALNTDDLPSCSCNECAYMKLNTLAKLYNTLRYEWPEVKVEPEVIKKARRPINEMLRISKELGI
jgi:quinolinate synthase